MAVHVDRSMRLPDAEFFPGAQQKSGIAIHHTVGGSATSTVEWWLADTHQRRPPQANRHRVHRRPRRSRSTRCSIRPPGPTSSG